MRSSMMLLAVAIGVAAVIMLTALGEGARRYVTSEFASLGTNLVIVIPGRTSTGGVNPALMSGDTPRDLTLGDMEAVRRLPTVSDAAPLVIGQGTVSSGAARTPNVGNGHHGELAQCAAVETRAR